MITSKQMAAILGGLFIAALMLIVGIYRQTGARRRKKPNAFLLTQASNACLCLKVNK